MASPDQDEGFEEMLAKLEEERLEEEETIANLQEELTQYQELTDDSRKKVQSLRLEVETAMNRYERNLRIQMDEDKKLREAAEVLNSLKDDLISLGNMLPGCNKLEEFLLSQIEADERQLSVLEEELLTFDWEAEYNRLEAKLAEETEIYKAEKEYNDVKVAEFEDACKHLLEEHEREKKRLASSYEPQIKKFREGTEHFKKRLQEEQEREVFLRAKLAQEKEIEESLINKIGKVEADMEDHQKSFNERRREKEQKLAQMQGKLKTETQRLQKAQKLEVMMRNDSEGRKTRIEHLRRGNKKLRERLAETGQKRKEEEEVLAAVEKCNSSLEETVNNIKAGISVTQAENSEIKQKIQRIKAENQDLNEVLLSNRKSFEEKCGMKTKQLNALKAKRLALEEALSSADETKAKLETVQKEKAALVAENLALDRKNEELERRIAGLEQDIEDSRRAVKQSEEKLGDAYQDWSNKVSCINLAIEEKRAHLEDLKGENAELMAQLKELKTLEKKERSQLAGNMSERKENHRKLTEECDRRLKTAEDNYAALVKEKKTSSAKYKELYLRMEKKLESRNGEVAAQQEQLASTLEEYKMVQENMVRVQELLYQSMENDNQQLMRKMIQEVKEHSKVSEADNVLSSPVLSTPVLSSESVKKLSGAKQPSSSSHKTPSQTTKASQKLPEKIKPKESKMAAPPKRGGRQGTKNPASSKKATEKPVPSDKDTSKGSGAPLSTPKDTFLVPSTSKKGVGKGTSASIESTQKLPVCQKDKRKESETLPSARKDTHEEAKGSLSVEKETPKPTGNASSRLDNSEALIQHDEVSSQCSEVSSTMTSDSQRLSQPLTQVVSQSSRSIEVIDIGSDSGLSQELF